MASFATRSELKILGRRERENFASLSTIYGVNSRKVFGVKIGRKKRSKKFALRRVAAGNRGATDE